MGATAKTTTPRAPLPLGLLPLLIVVSLLLSTHAFFIAPAPTGPRLRLPAPAASHSSSRSQGGVGMLLDLFTGAGKKNKAAAGPSKAERARLKKAVFESIQGSDMGFIKGEKGAARKATIAALQALAAANPTPDSAVSQVAEGCWDLIWTTEDEIHTFRKGGLLGCACEAVYQETDQATRRLENVIEFAKGSYLRITSELKPEAQGTRVYFSWINARVGYRGFELPLPRFVQNAWYENIYLDDEIRVVKDIRGNFLIVKRVQIPARTPAA